MSLSSIKLLKTPRKAFRGTMKHEHHEHSTEHSPDKSPEPHSHKPFYKSEKFWGITLTIAFLLIAIFTAVHLRLYTADLKVTDDWAAASIKQQVVNQITANIKQAYPTLPDSAVASEADKQWQQFAASNAAQIQQQSKLLSEQFKTQFQFVAGPPGHQYNQTYVLEMDPYLYWHQAVNYADHGTICDLGTPVQPNGDCTDMKRLAPIGAGDSPNLLIYTEAAMIKMAKVFAPNLDSLTVIFYIPAILLGLCVIPIFFIGRRLAGSIGGFTASILFSTHPVILGQTMAGFVKVTGYNLLFALLVVWFILEAFAAKKWWTRLTLAALSGISVGLYSFSWVGWWFLFFVVAICIVALMFYEVALVIKHHHWKLRGSGYSALAAPAAVLGVFFVFSALSVSLLVGFSNFSFAFLAPFTFTANLQSPTNVVLPGWPNILTTVAELNIPSLATVVSNMGGTIIIVFAAFGMFVSLIDPRNLSWKETSAASAALVYYYILISKGMSLDAITFIMLFALPLLVAIAYIYAKDIKVNLSYPTIMMGWLLASLFATTRGTRFLLLGIAPFALGFGIALGWLFIAITTAAKKAVHKPFIVEAAVGAIILLLVFNPAASYNPIKLGDQAARQQIPGMDDGWWTAMAAVRDNTPANTIITSWWDFGHWFRNIGNRSVTFDGGSQNPQPGYWVGKILLTPDENQALGILRMLDCGQNTAFETAQKTLDVLPAKRLVDSLILMNRSEAENALKRTSIPATDQQLMLQETHCTPPPSVFITSGDMIGKSGVWGHFGSWDFGKALSYNYVQSLPQAEAISKIAGLNYSETEATAMYYTIRAFTSQSQGNSWISGWPGYLTQDWHGCNQDNESVTCSIYTGITQTSQGVLAIETVNFNASQPQSTTISYGIYNNNVRLGGAVTNPARVVLADVPAVKLSSWNMTRSDLGAGVLIRKTVSGNQTSYAVLLTDPSQLDSMFTQLYFLGGVFNTQHFKKFIETQEPGGSRIVVWNVIWPKD